jgi:nucleoside-diphosphate-sugar epimerase
MNTEHLLIIGKNSSIGSCLTRYFTCRNVPVTAVGSADCNFLDRRAVAGFFERLPRVPYRVIFLAVVNKSVANTYDSFQDNLLIIRNFIEHSRQARIDSMIYFSSVDVYGRPARLPITEDTPVNPDTWYGLAKYNAEWMLRNAWSGRGPLTVLRIPGVYGPAVNDRSVIGRMAASVQESRKVIIHGDGNVRRDYVHVIDVCRIVEALMQLRSDGTFNVATGSSCSIAEMVHMMGKVFGTEIIVERKPADRTRDFDLEFDVANLTGMLPGFTFTDLEAGIESYCEGLCSQRKGRVCGEEYRPC